MNTAFHKIARKPVPSYVSLPAQRHRRVDSRGSRLSVQVSPKPPNALRGVVSLWKWEITSLSVSCVVFIVAIVILRAYENKGLVHWKAPISINAVIAIISTIFKGALIVPISNGISQLKWLSFSKEPQSIAAMDVYDQASRGAWGSLLFIIKQFRDKRLSTIASFGALIALTTLITEPFSQASVSIGFCQRILAGAASVPRSNNYISAIHTGAMAADPLTSMQMAVLTGLYNAPPNSSQSMSGSIVCQSGNCTFSADNSVSFSTLTMCHSCKDVSDHILGQKRKADDRTETVLAYYLPGYPQNLTLANPGGGKFEGVLFGFNSSHGFFSVDDAHLWPDGPWNSTTLLSTQGLTFRRQDRNCDGELCELVPFAFDCSFRPCVQSFSARVEDGRYTEKELSRQYLHAVPATFFQTVADSAFIKGKWTSCTGSKHETTDNTVYVLGPESQNFSPGHNTDAFPRMWYPPECVYHIGIGSSVAISSYIQRLFSIASLQMGENGLSQVEGEVWLQNLWDSGRIRFSDVDEFMKRFSLAIGAELRKNGTLTHQKSVGGNESDIATEAVGDVFYTETCIKVQWRFLSFLALLLVFEIIFFALVVFINHRSPQWRENWKSSALPLLFQAVDEKELDFHDDTSTLDKVDGNLGKRAKSALVRLVEEDGEWRFVMRHEHEPLITPDKH